MAHNVRHFITQVLLTVFSSPSRRWLARCVVFSSWTSGTHCVHVVAQLVNFSVQSLNVGDTDRF